MLGDVKRPYKKRYEPGGLEHYMASAGHVTGEPIKPGTVVTVIAHYGPFRRIRDEQGNEMSVGRRHLVPAKGVKQ